MLPDCISILAWYYGCLTRATRLSKLHSCLWVKSSSICMSSQWSGCADLTLSLFQCLTVLISDLNLTMCLVVLWLYHRVWTQTECGRQYCKPNRCPLRTSRRSSGWSLTIVMCQNTKYKKRRYSNRNTVIQIRCRWPNVKWLVRSMHDLIFYRNFTCEYEPH